MQSFGGEGNGSRQVDSATPEPTRDGYRASNSNGETNADLEEKDHAPNQTKHEPVYRRGGRGHGPRWGRESSEVAPREETGVERGGRTARQRWGTGPARRAVPGPTRMAGEQEASPRPIARTRAARFPRFLRRGAGQIRHLLADEDAGLSPRGDLQGRRSVLRRRLETAQLRPRGHACAGQLSVLRAAQLGLPQAVGRAFRLGQGRRRRQAPRQPHAPGDRALPYPAARREWQEVRRGQVAAAQL